MGKRNKVRCRAKVQSVFNVLIPCMISAVLFLGSASGCERSDGFSDATAGGGIGNLSDVTEQTASITNGGPAENSISAPTGGVGDANEEDGGYKVSVHYINVGDGECILIKTNTGKTMLIDTGSNAEEPGVLSYLEKQNITKIDYLILTHPHPDMIGGADAVMRAYEVDNVHAPAVGNDDPTFDDLIAVLREKGKKLKFVKAGAQFDMGPGIDALALSPVSKSYVNLNNYSIVIRLSCGNTGFLFAGDAEGFLQRQILAKGYAVAADVLKVSGSAGINSLAPEFLHAVSPKHAVISNGYTEAGVYPYPAVMKMLETYGTQIYMTSVSGDIVATTDGETIKFNVNPLVRLNTP